MLESLNELGHIAYFVVLPMLLIIAAGFAIARVCRLDVPTLTRLNFFLVVPGMVYFAVVSSSLTASEVGKMVGFSLLALVVYAAIAWIAAVLRRVPTAQRRAMLMTSMFYNSGNYALPLQELAFHSQGLGNQAMSLQVFVLLTQNIASFTLGIIMAVGRLSDGHWKQNLLHIAKFPPLYALAAAMLTVAVRHNLGESASGVAEKLTPFWDTISYAKDGFVVVALATLGAQLANVRRGAMRYPVTLSVLLRLIVGPATTLGLLKLLGMEGLVAQVLLIGSATPTSVTCLLLCLEFDNHPDFVARAVFYSTVLSPITVTLTILLAQSGML